MVAIVVSHWAGVEAEMGMVEVIERESVEVELQTSFQKFMPHGAVLF